MYAILAQIFFSVFFFLFLIKTLKTQFPSAETEVEMKDKSTLDSLTAQNLERSTIASFLKHPHDKIENIFSLEIVIPMR